MCCVNVFTMCKCSHAGVDALSPVHVDRDMAFGASSGFLLCEGSVLSEGERSAYKVRGRQLLIGSNDVMGSRYMYRRATHYQCTEAKFRTE
jgi:hypothetical protein